MKHNLEIKGTADFSQVSREVKTLTKTIVSSLGTEGAKLFDNDSLKFLRSEASNALNKMAQQLNKAVQEAANLDEQIRAATGEEEKQNELIKKRLELTKQIKTLKQDSQQLESASRGRIPAGFEGSRNAINRAGGRGAGSAVLGAAGQVASSLPQGVGQVAGTAIGAARTAGMATTATAAVALGTLAAAAGATILAFTRMSSAFEVFSQSVPKLITGAAIGVGEATAAERQTALSMGFTADETVQQKLDLARALGTTGTAQQQENMTQNTQMASRALGLDPSQITGTANQMRAVGGTQMAATATAQMLSRAMSEGMDRSQATHFLSATASTIQEINKNGLMATDAMIGAMATLSKDRMSPEMASRTLGGMQASITGSTGEANSFFQMAMAEAGVGAGTLAGASLGVAQGLFGVDPQQFSKTVKDPQALEDMRALGLTNEGGTGTAARAQGILDVLNREYSDTSTIEGRTARSQALGGMFGVSSLEDSKKIEEVLKELVRTNATTPEQKSFFEDLGKDPESKWRSDSLAALNTIAGAVAQTKAGESFTKFDLGKESAGMMNALTNSMMTLDKSINTIFGGLKSFFGGKDDTPSTANFGVGSSSGSGNFGIGDQIRNITNSGMAKSIEPILPMSPLLPENRPTAVESAMPELSSVLQSLTGAIQEGNSDRKKMLEKTNRNQAIPAKVNNRKHGG